MHFFKVKIALFSTLFFWASAFVGIRIGLQSYSPGALALLRFLVASFCMGIVYFNMPKSFFMPLKAKVQLALIGVGAIGIYNLCLNIGELTVSAGMASFVINLIPVLTILLSVCFLKERPSHYSWIGISISFLGLLLMIASEEESIHFTSGTLMIVVSALMGALYNILQKSFLNIYPPAAVTAWIIWGGTMMLMLFFPTLLEELPKAASASTWAAIYMGIFPGALAYLAWSYVIKQSFVTKASFYLYALPFISTLLGLILLKEYPGSLALSGGILALVGAFIANRFFAYKTKAQAC